MMRGWLLTSIVGRRIGMATHHNLYNKQGDVLVLRRGWQRTTVLKKTCVCVCGPLITMFRRRMGIAAHHHLYKGGEDGHPPQSLQ